MVDDVVEKKVGRNENSPLRVRDFYFSRSEDDCFPVKLQREAESTLFAKMAFMKASCLTNSALVVELELFHEFKAGITQIEGMVSVQPSDAGDSI